MNFHLTCLPCLAPPKSDYLTDALATLLRGFYFRVDAHFQKTEYGKMAEVSWAIWLKKLVRAREDTKDIEANGYRIFWINHCLEHSQAFFLLLSSELPLVDERLRTLHREKQPEQAIADFDTLSNSCCIRDDTTWNGRIAPKEQFLLLPCCHYYCY